jgi:shikimate kinase
VLTLVGLSGTGKSTVARLLAERWSWAYADVDERVESQAGRTITEIFAVDGEPVFRALESAQLNELLSGHHIVIAAGGGAPCQEHAMDAILEAGPCVWLSASPEVIAARVLQSEERPLLGSVDPARIVGHLSEQLDHREKVYTRAPFNVSTDQREPLAVVEAIEALLQAEGEGPWAP